MTSKKKGKNFKIKEDGSPIVCSLLEPSLKDFLSLLIYTGVLSLRETGVGPKRET